MAKYLLPETEMTKIFNVQMKAKIQGIEPMFYKTPAMKNPSWKNMNCL
jgi:hypothetical protein